MTPITDPVERAARIIAAHAQPYCDWDELTDEWRAKTRDCAWRVLDDLAAGPAPAGVTDDEPF